LIEGDAFYGLRLFALGDAVGNPAESSASKFAAIKTPTTQSKNDGMTTPATMKKSFTISWSALTVFGSNGGLKEAACCARLTRT
jgi:hypothetical protein